MYMEMSIDDIRISPVRTFGKFNFVYNRPERIGSDLKKLETYCIKISW